MKRWITIAVPVVILAGLIGWRLQQSQAKATSEAEAGKRMRSAPLLVDTATVARQDIIKTFSAVGNVEAPLTVDVSSKVSGRILSLAVREGDMVTAGQVLVRIDPAELQAEVRQREAALAQARSRLAEASITQGAQNTGIKSSIQQQQAAVRTAQVQNRQARSNAESQRAAAEAAVVDAEGRIAAAEADISAADAAIASAEANVANARTEVARYETLVKQGAAAQQVVDNLRTELQVQEAALRQARERRRAASAVLTSAQAQKRAAERQVQIAINRGKVDVAAASAQAAQAEAALEAARANRAQTPAYARNLEALQASVAAAQAEVRAAVARLADTTLRAPISGVVTQRPLDPGAMATPNQPILTVQQVRQVWATVSLPEEISRRIAPGQTAPVTFTALPGQTFTGRVLQVLPSADASSRQFTARVRLDNRNNRIKPGMFGRVTFVVDKALGSLVVPMEAVNVDPERPGVGTVTVVADGKAQVRSVRTGLDNGSALAVTQGVSEGEKVVILTTRPIRDGQAVRTAGDRPGKGGPGGRPGAGGSGKGSDSGQKEALAR